jgi:hypothetical protein
LQYLKPKRRLHLLNGSLLLHPQGLWDKNCAIVPDSDDGSVAEDAGEDDSMSSPLEDEVPIDEGAPSPPKNPLEGKIREPQTSDSEVDAEADTEAPKRKREAIAKKPSKKQKMMARLVQTKLTSVVKPVPSKAAPTKTTLASEAIIELEESSDDSDDLPRMKG